MGWFRQLFGKRLLAVSIPGKPASDLPATLVSALQSRDYSSISVELRRWCVEEQPTDADIETLLSTASRYGWPTEDREKLHIFSVFYRGQAKETVGLTLQYFERGYFDPDLFILCASALFHAARYVDAYAFLDRATAHMDSLASRADFHSTRAVICWAANDFDQMKEAIDTAVALTPTDTVVLLNALGMNLEYGDMNTFCKVKAELEAGGHRTGKHGFAYALVTLAQGDYENGFRLLEERYEMEDSARYVNRALRHKPRWQGEDLDSKTLLISAEQGLGDTIQMARYLPGLANEAAGTIVVETQPETLALLQFNFPTVQFLVREYGKLPDVAFDYWLGMMSLPHLARSSADSIPFRHGYLKTPADNRPYWRQRVAQLSSHPPGRRIGIAWSGQPGHHADLRRSIPFQKICNAIAASDADFFALQKQVPHDRPGNLIDLSEELLTLADTAALIDEMDLVITVDTSVVHLAGATAKETWLLLPYRYEWRWGLCGERNNWYRSVKVLRQPSHADWDSLLKEVFDQRLPERLDRQGDGQ